MRIIPNYQIQNKTSLFFNKESKEDKSKQSDLESKVAALELKLNEANSKIDDLQKALFDEKTKSAKNLCMSPINLQSRTKSDLTTVNCTNSVRKTSVDKCTSKNTVSIMNACEDTSYINSNYINIKRAKSTDTHHTKGISNQRYDYEEDLEFQNLELNAIYEAKVDTILYKKSKNQQTKDIMNSLKSIGEVKSDPLPNKNTIEKVFEDTIKQNASLKAENSKLRLEIKKLKLKLGK